MTKTKNSKIITQHYDYMLMALLPLMVCASFIYSARVLLVCGTAFITARVVDVGVAVLRKQEIDTDDKSSAVAALTFCMMLPVSIPLYIVAVTVALTVLVGKHVFGGKDVYPFNLAALAMCVAAVNWPEEVFKAVTPMTAVNFWTGAAQSTSTALSQIKLGGLPYISTFNLLLGNHAAAMGSAFVLVILSIGLFLVVTKRITWHVPVAFLATCSAIAMAFPRIYGMSFLYSLKYEILCSAIVFYAVFMLNEPATTPKKPQAKLVFGVLTGVLTMLFRYYGSYEIGGCFAILLVNATEGFWDRLFEKSADEEKAEHKTELKAGHKTEPKAKPKHKPAVAVKEESKSSKKVYTKESKAKPAAKKEQPVNSMDKTTTLDIISRAEDDIDQVSFSTQTIDMEQALREFEEKYNKGGK